MLCVAALAFALAGCSAGGAAPPPAFAFAIAAPAEVDAGASTTLTATAVEGAAGPVTWTIVEGPGSLSEASADRVVFSAPIGPTAATTRIQVADAADPRRRATVDVKVRGVELVVSLPGDRASVASGEVSALSASIRNLAPSVARRLRWTLDGIPANALAVASDTFGATLTAPIFSADASVDVRAALEVTGAAVATPVEMTKRLTVTGVRVSVSASGNRVTIASGETVQLTAAVLGLAPGIAAPITWSMQTVGATGASPRTSAWKGATSLAGVAPALVVAGDGAPIASFEAPVVMADTTYTVWADVGFANGGGPATVSGSTELTVTGVSLAVSSAGGRSSVASGEALPLKAVVSGLAPAVGRRVGWAATVATGGAPVPDLVAAGDGATATFTAPIFGAPARYTVTAVLSVEGSALSFPPAALALTSPGVTVLLTAAGGKNRLVAGDSVQLTAALSGLAATIRPTLTWEARVAADGSSASRILSVRADTLGATFTAPAVAASRTYVVSARLGVPAPEITGTLSIATVMGDLVINEVGNAFYYDVQAWFEVYNPTPAAVDLGVYTLRSRGINPVNGSGDVGSTTFPLPPVTLPPGGYLLVAGKVDPFQFDGPSAIRIANERGLVPFWFGSGYLELLKDGRTADFVRFGSSGEAPTTGAFGGAAPALNVSDATQYGTSIARDLFSSDSDSGADWLSVGFATPGAPNDVPPNAMDGDGDGIPSSAKAPGRTFAGIDLYAMGARPGQRDVFLELDRMTSTDPGMVPQREALDRVVAAFAAHGIALHIDVGPLFSPTFDPAAYNLGQAQAEVPFAPCVTIRNATSGCGGDARRYKAAYMELPRAAIFHYGLFASSQAADGGVSASGLGEVNGNDFIVTLGQWGLTRDSEIATNILVNFQSATLMHELGHNLNLRHGGGDDVNYKPNYLSVMNYMYQLYGVPDPASGDAGDRYGWYRWRSGNWCAFANGPCGSPNLFAMSYSSGASAVLDEASLQEVAGLGRAGATPVDFNGDGVISPVGIPFDLNGDGALSRLRDWDDWGNISLPFHRNRSGQPGVSVLSTALPSPQVLSPANDDDQDVAHETPPPPEFFEALRRAR